MNFLYSLSSSSFPNVTIGNHSGDWHPFSNICSTSPICTVEPSPLGADEEAAEEGDVDRVAKILTSPVTDAPRRLYA